MYLNPHAGDHRYFTKERDSPWSEFSYIIVRVRKRTKTRRGRRVETQRFDAVRYLGTCCCWRGIIKHWGSYVRLVTASWQRLCFPQVLYILYRYIVYLWSLVQTRFADKTTVLFLLLRVMFDLTWQYQSRVRDCLCFVI